MLEFQPGARAYLSKIGAISTDADDNVVYTGLTATESVWYADYLEASFGGTADRSDRVEEKYLALQERHEKARLAVLADEGIEDPVQAPIEKP